MSDSDSSFSSEFVKDFDSLYDKLKRQRFEPTLPILNHNLRTLLDAKFGASPRLRLRVEPGRIKTANRLLLKAQLPKYRPKITNPADIFNEIRDIVGTRITCNTLNDAYAVSGAIKAVAINDLANRPLVRQCDDFEDDYIKEPKESGYRALSLLVGVPVAIGDHTENVTCEIQIRTLLQHAWGELTHEDTYKPEMKTPALIVLLSKRLANALAVLDEIAQDIRDELDKLEIEQAAPIPLHESASITQIVSSEPPAGSADTDGEEDSLPSEPVLPQRRVRSGRSRRRPEVPPSEHLPPPPAPILTVQTIQAAFKGVFGREPDVGEDLYDGLLTPFRDLGISSVSEVEATLRTMLDSIKIHLTKYDGLVTLNDYGCLLHAPAFGRDINEGLALVKGTFEEHLQKENAKEQFQTTFQVGKEVLGTVVHVAPDYALVQLPEGATGIMHVTTMKDDPRAYVDVHKIVMEGDTVRVRILRADAANSRIELSLVQAPPGESASRRSRTPRW